MLLVSWHANIPFENFNPLASKMIANNYSCPINHNFFVGVKYVTFRKRKKTLMDIVKKTINTIYKVSNYPK